MMKFHSQGAIGKIRPNAGDLRALGKFTQLPVLPALIPPLEKFRKCFDNFPKTFTKSIGSANIKIRKKTRWKTLSIDNDDKEFACSKYFTHLA